MDRKIIFSFLIFVIVPCVSLPLMVSAYAVDYQGNNILNYLHYNQTAGSNTVFSNSTGVYVSGEGTVQIKLNVNSGTVHFNQDGFTSNDFYYGVPNDSTPLPHTPTSVNTFFKLTGSTQAPDREWGQHNTHYEGTSLWGETLTHSHPSWAGHHIPNGDHWELYTQPDYPLFAEVGTSEFTKTNINYDVFARLVLNSTETIHLRAENYILNPSVIINFTSTVLSDRIILDWECPVYDGIGYNNGCTNISNYNVLRDGISLTNTTSLSYTDYTFAPDTTYDYSIITTNTNSDNSVGASLQVTSLPEFASPVLQLNHNGDSITITWTDPYPDVTQFTVKRITDGKTWNVSPEQKTIIDNDGIILTDTYSYQIQSRTANTVNDWSPTYSISYPSIRMLSFTYDTVFDTVQLYPTIQTNENGHGNLTKFSVKFNPDTTWYDIPYSNTIPNNANFAYPNTMTYTLDSTTINNLKSVTILADFETGGDPEKTITVSGLSVPVYKADLTGDSKTATQINFNSNSFSLHLKKESPQYGISCQYADLTNGTTWYNQTTSDVYSLKVNTGSYKVYVDCWNADGTKISSSVYQNDSSQYGFSSLDNLGSIFGKFAGVSIPLLFVIFVGAIFTAKNAHMGVLVLGGTIGIMGVLGFLTVEPLMWGLIVLLIILGLFTGKKS